MIQYVCEKEGKGKERKNQIQRRITSGIILLYGVAEASREDISCTYETFILVKKYFMA